MTPIRVLIADDSVLIRRVLREVLDSSGSFTVVAEAADGQAAVRLAEVHRPDLVLVDLAMPVLDGFQSVPLIREGSPESRIVVLSGFTADRMAAPVLELGAHAYLEKGQRPDVVIEKLLAVCGAEPGPELERLAPPPAHDPVRSSEELLEFASIAAHDLRSPLQVISGFAALLERGYGPALDERGREFIGWISASAARMEALIDALLEYARVGAAPEPVPVDLECVVEDAVGRLGAEIARTGATVTWDPLPVVAGEPGRLTQVLQNLVANAVRFVAEGTAPVVHITAHREDDPGAPWCVSVTDNGIGVDAVQREAIFALFKRLHAQDRYDGTGVGLAICRRIVEMAGGRIWVEPAEGGGSTFRFTVP
ncbi:MAG: sensor histidine kinase, partial [Acidimicrobiales bacterium]